MDKKIITSYVRPPIPIRGMDWQTHYENEEESNLLGSGETEQEAIDNLIECGK